MVDARVVLVFRVSYRIHAGDFQHFRTASDSGSWRPFQIVRNSCRSIRALIDWCGCRIELGTSLVVDSSRNIASI